MTTPITCLQCTGLLGPDDRFCAQCGAELLWCASCGEFLLQSDETCPKCGTPGIPRPDSRSISGDLTEEDSPWAEVVARLRRATLGEFEIGHELGRGGMAAVFLAHELSLHRDVAIKVMSPAMLMGDGMIDRFRREAITIAHLNHPNIVSVYSVRAAEGLHFFVMRCIQGRSLEQVLKDAGRLPLATARSILYHVGSALAYAHRFKVVHRDIKPANILIDEDGNAVVTDFGIAKAAEGPSHTHTGFMVGTPAYMSPEQCAGGEVSGASDQYSLGVVAYEMITGVPPFTGSTYSVIQAHVEQPPRPLHEHGECPPEVESAILRMLAKNPEERFPSMTQALTALGAAALPDDDLARAELSRFAMAGSRTTFVSGNGSRVGGKSSAVLQATPPGMMRAVSILPPPAGLEVGDSFLLVARVHDGQAARLPTSPVQWSSDSPGVLRVNATKAVATAVTSGTALIRAVCDGQEGRLRVTVAPPRADSIVVKAVEKAITVGDEIRLEANPRDKRGRPVSRPVTWRSEDDTVATVSLDGLLVARSAGSARVVAELDEARANVGVTVLPPRVAAVHISAAPDSVVAGDSFALTATPLDRWAGALTDRSVAWSVSDVNTAVVTAGGWVITRNPGHIMLTAVCEGVSSSISVNVLERAPEPIVTRSRPDPIPWELPPEPRSPEPRRSRRRPGWLVAAGGAFLVAGGFWLVGGRRQADQPTMPETAVALRDSSVSTDDPSFGSAGYVVTSASKPTDSAVVDTGAPVSVTITQRPSRPLVVGMSSALVAESRDASGKMVGPERISWSSTDTTVVTVDSAGVVQAVARGRAQVIAAAGAWRDSAGIVVRPAPRTPVLPQLASLSIASPAPLRVGDTLTLALTGQDESGKSIPGVRATWSSSDPSVASVDQNSGLIRARAAGGTLIIARSGEESAISSVSVAPAQVASVDVSGARPLKVGDTLDLRAAPRDQRGVELSGHAVVWASSNPDVASVDSSGVVVALAAGSSDMSARVDGKTGKVQVTVLPQPRTSRTELAAEARSSSPTPAADPAAERLRLIDEMRQAVDRCYNAVAQKDVSELEELYHPESKTDRDNLKKLSRILRTSEWAAQVGEREDGAQRIGSATASMEFGFRLSWKDSFGGRLTSQPVFRVDFVKDGSGLNLTSCRIIGTPDL
ncbi:MAG: protein kinase domain-containing protein [Gemmatimonadales bacterium]